MKPVSKASGKQCREDFPKGAHKKTTTTTKLTNHLDLQFSYEAYWCQHEEYFITAVYVRSNGIGDPTYKTKHHKLTQGQEV